MIQNKPNKCFLFHMALLVLIGQSLNGFAVDLTSQTEVLHNQPIPDQAQSLEEVVVISKRQSLNDISDKTGGSLFHFSAKDIDQLPQGDNTPLNQVLLQAPGVVQDSYGQVHVRGDHANLQYQINGVVLPQGLFGFGNNLDTRFAQTVDLLDGALPAQYGLHTAGIVEITTKDDLNEEGSVTLYGGSYHTFNPSFQYGDSKEDLSYFLTGSFLTDSIGIENPAPSANPTHDKTRQSKGFGLFSYKPDASTKYSLMVGTYTGAFQIPTLSGVQGGGTNLQNPYYSSITNSNSSPLAPRITNPYPQNLLFTNPPIYGDSSLVNDQQFEQNQYAVLTLQRLINDQYSYQSSIYSNYSTTHYIPDAAGNLYFSGSSADVFKKSLKTGLQSDYTFKLNDNHTVKTGFISSTENNATTNSSLVYSIPNPSQDEGGGKALANGSPFVVSDNNTKNGNYSVGLYVQDSWQITSKLTTNYGLRYDYFNAFVAGNQLSPRLGFVFKESESTTMHAGYSHYFTPPPNELVSTSIQSLFANTTLAATGTNNSVKPEVGDYYDIGFSKRITKSYTLSADTFLKNTQNLIDEGQFSPAPILTPYNYQYGKIYGAELSNSFKSGKLSAYLNLTYNVSLGKNIISSQYLFSQQTLQYSSANWLNVDHGQTRTISGGASYLLNETRFNVSMIYGGGLRSGFANTELLPSYTVLNLGATRTITTSGLGPIEYRFSINNVFDHGYEIRDGSGVGVFAPQYGQRRAFYTGLTKRF